MQELVCQQCDREWQRPPQRGRKPSLCPTCQDGGNAPESAPDSPPVASDTPKPQRKHKSKWVKLKEEQSKGKKALPPLAERPFTQRPTGWCTDYDPRPEAQHEKCDGDIGKYRCPCECHGWVDGQVA